MNLPIEDIEEGMQDDYGVYNDLSSEDFTGTILVDPDYGGDRWEWRITSHEV